MTPAQLRKRAAVYRAKAGRLMSDARERAGMWLDQAELLERTATDLEALAAGKRLRVGVEARKVLSEHMQRHFEPGALERRNLAISKAKSDDRLAVACRKHHLTKRQLASELGIVVGSLIAYQKGVRAIPGATADAIAARTGYAATPENWPGGIRR